MRQRSTTTHEPEDRTSDEQLIEGILAGEPECFERLYQRHRDRIFRFALKRLRDASEAEDVTQETFLQIHRSLPRFEGRSSVLTWMFGIANNQVCRQYRRRTPTPIPVEDIDARVAVGSRESRDRELDARHILEDCNRALEERISRTQAEVFRLRYADNESTRAIAQRLGKSNQAVKISLFRTRQALLGGAARELHAALS